MFQAEEIACWEAVFTLEEQIMSEELEEDQ